jgi:hypothetical protein
MRGFELLQLGHCVETRLGVDYLAMARTHKNQVFKRVPLVVCLLGIEAWASAFSSADMANDSGYRPAILDDR